MKNQSLGVFLYPDNNSPAELVDFAQRIESPGYDALWYPEVMVYESFTLGTYLFGQPSNLTIASGIANTYGRDAMGTLQASQGIEAMYPRRYSTGLGVSHQSIVTDIRGHEYGKPMGVMTQRQAFTSWVTQF